MEKEKKILLLLLVVVLVVAFLLFNCVFISVNEQASEDEIKYNEMLTVYDEIVEEHGEYSLEALEYNDILDEYEPHYRTYGWWVIVPTIFIVLFYIFLWYMAVKS